MNKQSNIYTVIYIIVLVLLVGTALAVTALSLSDRQQSNIEADKMCQILASAKIASDASNAQELYSKYITETVINDKGETIDGKAFDINVAAEVKLPAAERKLPVFIYTTDNGEKKYILPAYGAGLWGPIWGYISVNENGKTVYSAFFAHQGETPGLGAEIDKPAFQEKFNDKELISETGFHPIAVVKNGQTPAGAESYTVDGISGGTITSKGVSDMLDNCLTPYKTFLENLSTK